MSPITAVTVNTRMPSGVCPWNCMPFLISPEPCNERFGIR